MFKSKGKFFVGKDGSVKLLCDFGLLSYYKAMIEKRFFAPWEKGKTQSPLHGAHVSIIVPKVHGRMDLKSLNRFRGKLVEFSYDPKIQYGLSKRGFYTFWLKVECPFADKIKEDLGVKDGPRFSGLHLTICNTKYELNK